MIPVHCREVGVKKVSFPLTRRNIIKEACGKSAYANTNYLVLNNGSHWAILKINKAIGQGLFLKIDKTEIVSLPADTIFLEDPEVDVQNPSVMVRLAERSEKDALVVKGKFEHISFVYKERITSVVVIDVTPPDPPKIVQLAEAALATGRIKKPIKIIPRILNLNEIAQNRKTRYVMFPCYASSLASGPDTLGNALYLDQTPPLDVPLNDLTLVGCDLSQRIFFSIYGQKPAFIDMCPKNVAKDIFHPCLSRCCLVDAGHAIEGNAAYVSWGASVGEVEEAIIDLLGLDMDPLSQ